MPGLDPMEAVDRLKKFQQMFEVRKRKWTNYGAALTAACLLISHLYTFAPSMVRVTPPALR